MTDVVLAPTKPSGVQIRDRICLFGNPDAGKTHALLTVARWHKDLGSPANFYIVNTDFSYDALFEDEQFADLDAENGGNVHVFASTHFGEIYDWVRKVSASLTPHDWLGADLADDLWTSVQSEYTRKIYGDNFDVGDLWLNSDPNESHPIKGWDWGYVNARYDSLVNTYFVAGRGHRFMIARAGTLITDPTAKMKAEEDEYARKAREVFKHVGVKLAGQKKDPWRWDSILYVQGSDKRGVRETSYLTAREKRSARGHLGRQLGNEIFPEVMEDFYMDYLVKRGGWKV